MFFTQHRIGSALGAMSIKQISVTSQFTVGHFAQQTKSLLYFKHLMGVFQNHGGRDGLLIIGGLKPNLC